MKFRKILLLIPLMVAVSGVAHANGFFVGPKVGIMHVNINEFGPAVNLGVLFGYEFRKRSIAWGPELDLTFTIAEGDYLTTTWKNNTQGIYAFFKYGDPFYVKVKIGSLHENISASGYRRSDNLPVFGTSAGVGGGWRITDHFVLETEVIFTEVFFSKEDIMFYSLGARYHF